MGSINPVFLLPGAVAASAKGLAAGLHGSVTLGVGQFCTNPGLVFMVDEPSATVFLNELAGLLGGTAAGTMLTPSICREYHAGLEAFSKIPGVQRLTPAPTGPGQNHTSAQTALFVTDVKTFSAAPKLLDEIFGPSTVVVRCANQREMVEAAEKLDGQLTATIHATPGEQDSCRDLLAVLESKAGRLVWNGFPTGVEVCHAMVHGGPYPATADGRSTSVGTRAIERFARPVCYQNFPETLLPAGLQEANPRGGWRLVDGKPGQG
jgi:NADP-dependent aldehyde dehydrogenase